MVEPKVLSQFRRGLGDLLMGLSSPASNLQNDIQSVADASASVATVTQEDNTEKTQTTIFHNSVPGPSLVAPTITDSTFVDGQTLDTDIAKYLERPVLISSFTWGEGDWLNVSILPWDVWANTQALTYKLTRYPYLRCKLKIHVQVNASPFYSGVACVSYRPLTKFGIVSPIVAGTDKHVVPHSQRPSFWIDVAQSKGGDIELPFFYHKNWLQICKRGDFQEMGELRFDSPVVLKNANSVSGSDVSISVWASAVDVSLSGATATPIFATQSSVQVKNDTKMTRNTANKGRYRSKTLNTSSSSDNSVGGMLSKINQGVKDEYGKGVVSATSSAIASAAQTVSVVPELAPFATATSLVMNGISGLADYFGWTNVPNLANVEPVKSLPFHALASPSISTPVEKLSVDAKNELCVDSRTVGLDGTDELSIESILTRESYLCTYTFSEAHVPNSRLYAARVTPSLRQNDTVNVSGRGYIRQWHTPMSHACQLFTNWRGDITFKFVAVKTKFHAGRLLFQWDPRPEDIGDTSAHQRHNAVWDITESNEFLLTVPYGQSLSWLKVPEDKESGDFNYRFGPIAHTGTMGVDNGTIACHVLTQLTGPAAGALVDILVFVRACPNFQLNNPRVIDSRRTMFLPQSSVEYIEQDSIKVDSTVSALNLVTMGEDHISFRPLLHRTSRYLHYQMVADTSSAIVQARLLLPRFPLMPGYDLGGVHLADLAASGLKNYNYVPHTAFTWLAPCFQGWRGSVNYSVNVISPNHVDHVVVQRSQFPRSVTTFFGSYSLAAPANPYQLSSFFQTNFVDQGMSGMAMTNQKTQAGLSVNVPMYSRFRMLPTMEGALGSTQFDSNVDSIEVHVRATPAFGGGDAQSAFIELLYCMGPDFNLFHYINAPVTYASDLPSPSSTTE